VSSRSGELNSTPIVANTFPAVYIAKSLSRLNPALLELLMPRIRCSLAWSLVLLALVSSARAEHDGKVQILLIGDSTTEGSIPRRHVPKGPHLEEVIRQLLAAESDLPPTNVINTGLSGDYVYGLLSSGRYDKAIAKLPGIDYVFIRYGLNDLGKRADFADNFPKDYKELIARLRKDHPSALIIPMTVIPYLGTEKDAVINAAVAKVAEEEKLPLFDIYPRYTAELKNGPNMLNYRRYSFDKIPEKYREFAKPYVVNNMVEVLDNRLDAHFGSLPGWYGDRHPNLAGYNVIGDETAKYLAKMLREKK